MQHTLSLLSAQVGTAGHIGTSLQYYFRLPTDHHIKTYSL